MFRRLFNIVVRIMQFPETRGYLKQIKTTEDMLQTMCLRHDVFSCLRLITLSLKHFSSYLLTLSDAGDPRLPATHINHWKYLQTMCLTQCLRLISCLNTAQAIYKPLSDAWDPRLPPTHINHWRWLQTMCLTQCLFLISCLNTAQAMY